MKKCPKCGETKPFSEFRKCKSRKDGHQGFCKPCQYSYSKTAEAKKKKKEWREKNKEKIKKYLKKYREDNLEKCRERSRQHYRDNKKDYIERAMVRESKLKKSEIANKYKLEIKEIYEHRDSLMNMLSSIGYELSFEVDHIIPLNHPDVCGLHVPWNMQVIPKCLNLKKTNKFDGTVENENWIKGE